MVIALTGTTGVGKTTVAEELVKTKSDQVNIDVDHIKHMSPNAFSRVLDEDGDEDYPYSAWELLGENIGILAKNFMAHGYDVIINGYLEVESWIEIEKIIKIDYKFVLLPDIETNLSRDNSRTDELKMGEKAVKRGRDYFQQTKYYENFIKIDSTQQSVQETTQRIQSLL